jgi:hypothetical protein
MHTVNMRSLVSLTPILLASVAQAQLQSMWGQCQDILFSLISSLISEAHMPFRCWNWLYRTLFVLTPCNMLYSKLLYVKSPAYKHVRLKWLTDNLLVHRLWSMHYWSYTANFHDKRYRKDDH